MRNFRISFCLVQFATFLYAGLPLAAETEKVPKPITVLFVGDSISIGVGASSSAKRYTTLVVESLNKKHDDCKFTELNLGISGSTLVDQSWPSPRSSGYPYILQKVIKAKPDIVVIQHGTNDNAVGCSLGNFLWSYRKFIRTVKKELPKTKIVCMTICPSWSVPIADSQWLECANVGIQEIAACENTLIAHTNFMLHNRRELFPDGIHPNDEGHRIMADSVVKTIEANDIKSKDNFDFICSQPGQYRICGYVFDVKPQGNQSTGWACFYNVGKTGWSYISDYSVNVASPFKLYDSDFNMMIKNEQGERIGSESRWKNNYGQGLFALPANNGEIFKVIITTKSEGKKNA